MASAAGVNERLAALTAAGTSVWLDQIRRSMIEGGELQRMVDEESLRGVTSNPAIFEKAILGSPDYDSELAEGAREGLSARELYRSMAVRDVQLAADVLRPVYEGSSSADGFVSLEVAPRLAHDTEGTLEQARSYSSSSTGPNLMIKIPATDAGLGRDRGGALRGHARQRDAAVLRPTPTATSWTAYLRAMERRREEGLPLDRHSVASFFVSRVDTEVDKRLEQLERPELAGRAGLANRRAAYAAFREVFGGERFAALRSAGCPVQRPLWASTGVKNPHYPRDDVRRRARRTRHRQHHAAADPAGRRGALRGVGDSHRGRSTRRRTSPALADAGIDPGTTSPTRCCARGYRGSSRR
jgi:transaldolase